MTHQKFFVTKQDGTLLIDGIGYCFPDKSQTKPKPNTYIQVTEVKAIEKNGKKFGFYKWEPADNTISEESLIEAYLANPRPAFLLSQIERMPLEKGEAIVLRHTEWHYRGRSCTVAGLSLNGWPEAEVSVRANTEARARQFMPSTPYFEDGRTMLDLLLQHGYGVVSDEDIFAAIKDTVNNPNSSLVGEVPYGTIYRGLYHNRPITFVSRNMLSWHSSAALIGHRAGANFHFPGTATGSHSGRRRPGKRTSHASRCSPKGIGARLDYRQLPVSELLGFQGTG